MPVLRCAALVAAAAAVTADYVHTVRDGAGAWWFEHNGKRFLSFVANHVNNGGLDDGVGGRERAVCQAATNNSLCGDSLNFGGTLGYAPYHNVTVDKYGPDPKAWAEAAVQRLGSWGFNGISGWSATVAEKAAAAAGMYYWHLLDIGVTWPFAWSKGLDYDVFSANFSAQAEAIAAAEVPGRATDPWLIGWQTDNEINWGAVGLACYLQTYAAGSGGAAVLAWLQGRYVSLAALNAAWHIAAQSWADVGAHMGDAGANKTAIAADDGDWQGVVADRYFNVTTGAIRAHDPNHLVSGVRFAVNSVQIVTAAGRYCDVIDQHDYSDLPDVAWLAQITALTARPVVLGEFSFTAADSNLPNTHGARAGNPAGTQTARTRLYAAYARALITAPNVIGYGWWNFVDEPATGRWPDGENSNYGLLTLADDPYSILTANMTAVHAAANAWHTNGAAATF